MTDIELVKAEIAAKATGLHMHFLYRLAARGQVPCFRAGRALRFSIPELRDWMRREAEKRRAVEVTDGR